MASISSRARRTRRRSSSPDDSSQARCRSSSATRSSSPSPARATVLTIGGSQPPSGRSASLTIDRRSRPYLVGALAVGLVDHEHVADLEDAGLRGLDAVAHAGREEHDGGVGQRRDLDLALARRPRSRRAPRRSRPRRARAAPAGSSTPARRGGRGRPSSGCRRPSSSAWSPIRTRSPSSAPPENGDDGSIGQHADPLAGGAQLP